MPERIKFFAQFAENHYDHHGEMICGDSFCWHTTLDGSRTIAVLSDGMGHGIKANILSTLTATMLMKFTSLHENVERAAEMIVRSLPVCRVRGVSYSTFTLLEIDNTTGEATLVQHDNPPTVLIRNAGAELLTGNKIPVQTTSGKEIFLVSSRFNLQKGDMLVLTTDGITQSGQKNGTYRFGWDITRLREFIKDHCGEITDPHRLGKMIVDQARGNDAGSPSDDMTCVCVAVREPRRTMVISCPPSLKSLNSSLGRIVEQFPGEKIICGHPVARILAVETGSELRRISQSEDPLKRPLYQMDGFELVTEGVTVTDRLLDLLLNYGQFLREEGTAGLLLRKLLNSDEIHFVIGLRRNLVREGSKHDIYEIRRSTLKRIMSVLEQRFGKRILTTYI